MGQVTVIYLTGEQMINLWFEITGNEYPWDGVQDITLESVPHVAFRKAGTIE